MTDPAKEARRRRGAIRLAGKLAVGVLLAGLFLYLFLRNGDLEEVGAAIGRARFGVVLLATVTGLLGFGLRALRWRRYLRPMKVVGVRSCFDIMMIGYLVSTLLPGRVGDFIVRPLLMGQAEGIPRAATLATVAVERLFDTLTVLAFFAVYLVLAPGCLRELGVVDARYLGGMLLLVSVSVVVMLVLLRGHQQRGLTLLARSLGWLPARLRDRALEQAGHFVRGLNLFSDLRNGAASVLLSLGIWVTVGLAMWLVTLSLGLGIGPQGSFFLMGLGALGVAIPVPAGVGSFHYLMELGLRGLGVQQVALAKAAAILTWGITFIPIAAIGAVLAGLRGLGLAEIEVAAVEPEAAP